MTRCLLLAAPLFAAVSMAQETSSNSIIVRSLGPRINSSSDDYGPSVSGDGTLLYFTSTRVRSDASLDADFYFVRHLAQLGDSVVWNAPVNLGAPINTHAPEAVCSISRDGLTMFFTACGRDASGCDLYSSERIGEEEWANVHPLSSAINSTSWESQPCVSDDEQTLYFASDRPGGVGGSDIWFSVRNPDGSWGEAQNAGPVINTPGDEGSPFIAADGKTLYFASNTHHGLGGMDFFRSERTRLRSDGTIDWSMPENLGAPINSPFNEEFLTITNDGSALFFSSDRPGGEGGLDLYVARLRSPIELTLSGFVRSHGNSFSRGVGASVIVLDATRGDTLAKTSSNIATGEYHIAFSRVVPTMKILVDAKGYDRLEKNIDLTSGEHVKLLDLELRPDPKPVITFDEFPQAEYLRQNPVLKDLRGAIVEEVESEEIVPLEGSIFFSETESELPVRFRNTASEPLHYNDVLEVYDDIVNIVGRRARASGARLTITGYAGSERREEREQHSRARAESVKKYLVETFHITPEKIYTQIGTSRETNEEAERVDISSEDSTVLMPFIRHIVSIVADPGYLTFDINCNVPGDSLKRAWIEIVNNRKLWNTIALDTARGPRQTIVWDWRSSTGGMVSQSTELGFLVAIETFGGRTFRSERILCSAEMITLARKRTEHLTDHAVKFITVIAPDGKLGGKFERTLEEYVLPGILPLSHVKIISGSGGSSGKRVANDRARAVVKLIEHKRAGNYASLEVVDAPEEPSPNDIREPEAQWYNRMMKIIIDTPR